ncbi:uncharacterized protein [Halyomorpha halys]|uniref:uncharacterized protein n=1 Tax=Halyomorpha halys TaxID=286706 RepID=UPI0006D51342|nr:uncharacterized protein LOC106686387 [Halyomorpha halys]XP_014285154.1 uncharacterized protein LOC106686387 [Halyomorpha halys]XP_014285155.1 uncharacterized protein LOC106686387 [Halyomorpha halys]
MPKQSRVKLITPISASSTSETPEMKVSNSPKPKENNSRRSSSKQYPCTFCNYTCDRMGMIIEHHRCHYIGLILPLPTQNPQNYCKAFQANFLKHKDCVSGTPKTLPKYVSEKGAVKRRSIGDSTPLKKRKYESAKKEKNSLPVPRSSLALPVKAVTPKKRPRKSKDAKTVSVRPDTLDVLKDDLEEVEIIDLTIMETSEKEDVKDTSKNVNDSSAEKVFRDEEKLSQQQPLQDHNLQASKEKCCFDFEAIDNKSVTVKEPGVLDILKDDLNQVEIIDLTVTKICENEDVKDTSKNINDSFSLKVVRDEEQLSQQQPLQDHNLQASKEKCYFDFEGIEEPLNLIKSFKFEEKLPRVISEEKPNVQKLLKEPHESEETFLIKGDSMKEGFDEIENFLKNTEVLNLPGIQSLPKPIEKLVTEGSLIPEKVMAKRKDLSKESIDVSSEYINIQSEDSSSTIQSVTSSQTTEQSATVVEAFTESENDSATDSPSEAVTKIVDVLPNSSEENSVFHFTKNSTSRLNMSASECKKNQVSSDIKNFDEKEYLTQEACSSKSILMEEISRNESKSSSNVSGLQVIINNDVDEADTALPSITVGPPLNKEKNMKEIIKKISERDDEIKRFQQQEASNIVEDDLTPLEAEVVCHEEMATPRAEEVQGEQNVGLQSIENISISEAKISNENNDKSLKEKEVTDKQCELNQSPIDIMKIQVLTSSRENDKATKLNSSTSSGIQTDQVHFDINSMPFIIDQDPIMEIRDGHVEPSPNDDVIRIYIRNSGEEEPEDFQSPRRLLTVSPPPPNLPPIPGIKKVPLPPPKNKNGANSSNKICGNTSSGSSTRYTLSKQPSKNTSQVQQPKILFINSTSGAPGKLLIPQQKSSIFAQGGKLLPGNRILTTNPQLVSKGSVQRNVMPKSVAVGKQGFPSTAKVVPKSILGQVIQKVPQKPIIFNKNTSSVLMNSPKTIVNRQIRRNVLLSSQQLKTASTAMQVTGAKIVRAAQIVKTPGTVFQQAETVLPHKVVQSTSALNENKKQTTRNVSGNAVFFSDSSPIPTTSGHLAFQLIHDNNLVSPGIMEQKSLKLNSDSEEDDVLPEFWL